MSTTSDDRRVRAALIQVHAVFEDPTRWTSGQFQIPAAGHLPVARCLMGEVATQLDLRLSEGFLVEPEGRKLELYKDTRRWFTDQLGVSPEALNDGFGREAVQTFLEQRIAELDAKLLDGTQLDAIAAKRSFVGALLQIFT